MLGSRICTRLLRGRAVRSGTTGEPPDVIDESRRVRRVDVTRTHEGKDSASVYDYVDSEVPVLRAMLQKRLKTYSALGFTRPAQKRSRHRS